MSKIRLHGSSSGYTEIAPVAASGNNTLTLPNDGTIISKDANGAVGVTSVVTTTATITTAKVGAAVTISESGIEASGIGITCASINGTQIGGRRNLIINGAMEVAQRATSSTSGGYQTLDRYKVEGGANGQTTTQSQQDLSSSDAPYTLGFRKYLRAALGSAGTANSNAYVEIQQRIEAQNVAKSGWNYTSSSSYITLQFWFRASTNQTFYAYFYAFDGTPQVYTFSFTASGNNTWTKVIKKIPGNSNLTFDNNTNAGLQIKFLPYYGTDYSNNKTLNEWSGYSGTNQLPDMASTWLTTGTPTFDLTGLQIEVGSQATPFEHRSHGEELALCRRYYYRIGDGTNTYQVVGNGYVGENGSTRCAKIVIHPLTTMRDTPTISVIGTDAFRATAGGDTMNVTATSNTGGIWNSASTGDIMWMDFGQSGGTTLTNGYGCVVYADNNSANLALSAEL